MNYRPLLDTELEKFAKEVPDFSFGQTVAAIMRIAVGPNFTKADLLNITDEEFYKHANIALRRERED